MRLPSALLLLWLPGCVTLSGPKTVTGTKGGSLGLQCWYKGKYKDNNKFWCRGSVQTACKKIVETKGSERMVSKGRVSIRDFPEQHNFKVTMWDLTVEDEDVYWCGIDTAWWHQKLPPFDSNFKVEVHVVPEGSGREKLGSAWKEMTESLVPPGSLLSSVHFLLLVFLKVPLLLSMLGAVLWVNRPQKAPVALMPRMPCPWIQTPDATEMMLSPTSPV
ncbi:PREDICTED: CMRF35-like molecule 6-like [Elephantulus edwardii]|uniref:CMRF35-like molecule 6-like n=1 Tax=Elephantulus edwardii TaxID=28737 RepID=UPI0003F0D9CA|nr:PREDICTED: CMRF35-like molecule 6-like [Elephantulus edwardii]